MGASSEDEMVLFAFGSAMLACQGMGASPEDEMALFAFGSATPACHKKTENHRTVWDL